MWTVSFIQLTVLTLQGKHIQTRFTTQFQYLFSTVLESQNGKLKKQTNTQARTHIPAINYKWELHSFD